MADRYWVGGSGTWDAASTTHWSTTSGGAGGASVPTSADAVYFDAASNATAYTVTVSSAQCLLFIVEAPASGNITWAGAGALNIAGRAFISSVRVTRTYTGAITFSATYGPWYNSFGVTLASNIIFDGVGGEWLLSTALTTTGSITVTNGTFTTNNYNVTASTLSSTNTNIRTINLGSSTVTLNGVGASVNLNTTTNLTFNAGTSQINFSGSSGMVLGGGGQTFYNVAVTGTSFSSFSISSTLPCVFNNLSVAGKTSAGVNLVSIAATHGIWPTDWARRLTQA